MKVTSIIAVFSAAFTPIVAAGQSSARVQLINDQSGAWANVEIPEDGMKRSIESLWCETAVADNGLVSATSAQLTAFQQGTACAIWQHPDVNTVLDARDTWASLAGGNLVELPRGYVACWST